MSERTIILVRHGRSALRVPKQIASDALRSTARRYNAAGIRRTPRPPIELRRQARAAAVIVCSDTRRAVESARALDGTREPLVDAVFREAGLPLSMPMPLYLSFDAWILIGRIAWFLGWSAGGESLTDARRRASTAVRHLIKLSTQHRSVMLVGHGVFNALISSELRHKGWSGPVWSPRTSHWTFACYSKRPA
jgi:broad specificity phosphatase PhoE